MQKCSRFNQKIIILIFSFNHAEQKKNFKKVKATKNTTYLCNYYCTIRQHVGDHFITNLNICKIYDTSVTRRNKKGSLFYMIPKEEEFLIAHIRLIILGRHIKKIFTSFFPSFSLLPRCHIMDDSRKSKSRADGTLSSNATHSNFQTRLY